MGGARAILGWVVVAFALMACPACVATANAPVARGIVVSSPPPAPLPDDRPARPNPASVWVGGYWHWTGVQYAWIPGHWDNPPPGATWRKPDYVVRDGAYFYQPGGWSPGTRNASAFH